MMKTLFWHDEDTCGALEKIDLGKDIRADIFLHGVCGIFALALHNEFGYDILVAAEENTEGLPWDERLVHAYCCKDDAYIDVRGITEDEDSFLDEFSDFLDRHSEYFEISPAELKKSIVDLMTSSEYEWFYRTAVDLIQSNKEEYSI